MDDSDVNLGFCDLSSVTRESRKRPFSAGKVGPGVGAYMALDGGVAWSLLLRIRLRNRSSSGPLLT